MSNDAYFQKKWEECQANMCTGCEFCNNCTHGVECNTCEVCSPPSKCSHGFAYGDGCETCEEEHERRMDAECDQTEYCKHDLEFSECHECGAEMDAAAERHREQQDWNHWHPVGDTE